MIFPVVTYETSEESEMKVAKNKKSNMIQENLGKLDLGLIFIIIFNKNVLLKY